MGRRPRSEHDELSQGWLFSPEDGHATAPPEVRRSATRKPSKVLPRISQVEHSASAAEVSSQLAMILHRLDLIEQKLEALVQSLATQLHSKESYTTLEVARILGKRPYTVREWCRLQRVVAEKTWSGRGQDDEWRISLEELQRIQNEGLLPLNKPGRTRTPQTKPR